MMKEIRKFLLIVFIFFISPSAQALNVYPESPFSLKGSAVAVTNYLFRGISETDNRGAFQPSFTLKLDKLGMYGTVWGSNVRLITEGTEQDANGNDVTFELAQATLELDTAIGITNSVTEKLSYDVRFVRYNYPDANYYYAYNEGLASVTYGFLTALIGYSDNVFNLRGNGTYYNLSANFDLPQRFFKVDGLSINGSVGHYHLAPIVGNSYNDYSLFINKQYKIFKLSIGWVDTNHKYYNNYLDRGRVVAMFTVDL